MKLKVPFYKQTSALNCGPIALKIVLEYLGESHETEELEKLTRIKSGKGVSAIRLAIASVELSFKTKFFSKSLYFDEKNLELDFYKKYADVID